MIYWINRRWNQRTELVLDPGRRRHLGTEPVCSGLFHRRGRSWFLRKPTYSAQELGKLVPQISIPDCTLAFHRKTHAALEAIFNHLIRNAVDHGLETESECVQYGRPARGLIDIRCVRTRDGVSICMRDDGHGLNLNRIQDKARSLGLLPSTADLGLDDPAQLIFEPGLSTRQQENQVSGRGMGLSAVRSLTQDLGGNIRVELKRGDTPAPALHFIIDLPSDLLTELTLPDQNLQKPS